MTEPVTLPPAEVNVSGDLVMALLADQHPDLAHQRLGDRHEGWDSLMTGYARIEGPMLMRARAEGAYVGLTLASISAEHYSTPGWRALRDLGLARRSG